MLFVDLCIARLIQSSRQCGFPQQRSNVFWLSVRIITKKIEDRNFETVVYIHAMRKFETGSLLEPKS